MLVTCQRTERARSSVLKFACPYNDFNIDFSKTLDSLGTNFVKIWTVPQK